MRKQNRQIKTLDTAIKEAFQDALNTAFCNEWPRIATEFSRNLSVTFAERPGVLRISDSETATELKLVALSKLVDEFNDYDLEADLGRWAIATAEELEKQAVRLRKWAAKCR